MKSIEHNNEFFVSQNENPLFPEGYIMWRDEIISLIEKHKYQSILNVNTE